MHWQQDNVGPNEARTFPFTPPGGGGPPSPPPGGGGGFGPGGGPGAGQGGPPTGPPPSFTPQQQQSFGAQGQVGVFAVDPGSLRRCLFRYTYIWLRNRQQFWFFPVFLGRFSVAGWRWIGWRWVYFGIDTRQIVSFQCF